MGLKPKWNSNAVRRKLQSDAERIEKAIIERMKRIGEQFVADCRLENTYKDRTGNLRSSIGYFILRDNVILDWNLYGKEVGISAAKQALSELSRQGGLRLVGVAGMEYASHVEAMGLNVITNQSMVAIDQLDEQLRKLARKTNQEINTHSVGISTAI